MKNRFTLIDCQILYNNYVIHFKNREDFIPSFCHREGFIPGICNRDLLSGKVKNNFIESWLFTTNGRLPGSSISNECVNCIHVQQYFILLMMGNCFKEKSIYVISFLTFYMLSVHVETMSAKDEISSKFKSFAKHYNRSYIYDPVEYQYRQNVFEVW